MQVLACEVWNIQVLTGVQGQHDYSKANICKSLMMI